MHRIPALVIDAGLRISGHQPFMGKIISKMEKATATLEFFSTRQWTWDTNNMEDLEKSLQPEDRKIFGLVKRLKEDCFISNADFYNFMLLGKSFFYLCRGQLHYTLSRLKYYT
jgi:hypothetical protein